MFKFYCPVDDAITYFGDRVSKRLHLADFARRTYKKHPAHEKLFEKVLRPGVELEKKLDEHYKTLDNTYEFFFKPDQTTSGVPHRLYNRAWLLLGSYVGFGDECPTFEALFKKLRAMPQHNRDILFINYLHDLEVKEVADSSVSETNCGNLLEVLRECALTQETRARLIDLYANFDEYVDTLENILAPAVRIIIDNEDIYAEAVHRTENLIVESGGVSQYMLEKYNFMMSERGEHHTHLCVLTPNSISVRDDIFENLDAFIGVNLDILHGLLYSGKDNQKISNMFKLLSDETRLEILHCICAKPMYGLEIAEAFSISAPTVSYHMRKLLASGFTESTFDGGRTYYHANVENIRAFIKSFEEFLLKDQTDE